MIKTVWFDIGGTIHTQAASAKNDAYFAGMLTERLQSYGIEEPPDEQTLLEMLNEGADRYKKYTEEHLAERPGDEIWTDFMFSKRPDWREHLKGHGEELSFLFDRYRKVITPRAKVKETIKTLYDSGYQLGVISNIMSRTFVPKILEEYGIRSYFETLILSSECGIRKSDPRIFDLALEQLHASREEACYIGDTISRDVLGTRKAGWKLMIQIDNPLTYRKDVKYKDLGYEPDYKIYDFGEIPEIIHRVQKMG